MNEMEAFKRNHALKGAHIIGHKNVYDLTPEEAANVLAQLAGQTRNPEILNQSRALTIARVTLANCLAVAQTIIVSRIGESIPSGPVPDNDARPDNGSEPENGGAEDA